MGRKQRQRAKIGQVPRVNSAPTHTGTRMARVAVSDDVWIEFRRAIGGRSIAEALGQLVEREVEHARSRRLREGELEPREVLEALDRAREQQADIAALVVRLEALNERSNE